MNQERQIKYQKTIKASSSSRINDRFKKPKEFGVGAFLTNVETGERTPINLLKGRK